MNEKDVVKKDEEQLKHLDDEINAARQHLKEQTHEGERSFIEEGSDKGETDNTIVPPG
jgi:hypothetical protein